MQLEGNISNKQTAETLPGAVIYESDSKGNAIGNGSAANNNGDFIFDRNTNNFLTARLVGFEPLTFKTEDSKIYVRLQPKTLNTVTVTAKRTYYKLLIFLGLAVYLSNIKKN